MALGKALSSYPTILQVCPALGDGGVERSTVEMARYIQQQGWRSLVASHTGKLLNDLTQSGTQHFNLPLHRKTPFHLLWNAWQLSKLVKKANVDLIHVRSRAPAWSVWLTSKLTSVPYITTFHGTHNMRGFGKKFYNTSMVRGVAVIANSQFIQQYIHHHFDLPLEDIPVARRGVDIEVFHPKNITANSLTQLRKELAIDQTQSTILCVGRLTRWKGQDVLLKALVNLPKELNWVCLLAGSADKTEKFSQDLKKLAAELKITKSIRFLGSRQDIPHLNALSDVAISPSLRPEAFGRAAIEALAMGTPSIATAHGGSLETIQDGQTGLLVPPGDVEALTQALQSLLTQPNQAKKMGREGQKWVQKNVTTQQTCQAEFAVYRKILHS